MAVISNLGLIVSNNPSPSTVYPPLTNTRAVFQGVAEKTVAQSAIAELNKLQHQPAIAATSKALLGEAIQLSVVKAVTEHLNSGQQSVFDEDKAIDVAKIVAKATELMVQHTIDIPRVVVVPKGEVSYGYLNRQNGLFQLQTI